MAAASETSPFGALLMRHRHAVGLSQEELAARAGLSSDAVAALERGRRRAPRPLTVRMLAEALALDDARRAEFLASSRDQRAARPAYQPPLPADELIGRERELADGAALLGAGRTRLLTLTGPGGVGKTRLALAVASAERHRFPEQCWVPLDALAPGADITAAVAAALGVGSASAAGEWDALADLVGERPLLLVLDNCEHVLAPSARLCEWLVQRCPGLHVLATSREPLRVRGETVRRVGPLVLPPPGAEPATVREAAAVRLFLARSAYPVPDEQLDDVIRLCRRLDGLALAIELAAARTNVLTPAQILGELERSAAILARESRTVPRRQRAVDSAVAWSHDLLSGEEQAFFAALSVFRDGWTLAGAQAVTGETDRRRTLELVSRLADKSLVQVRYDGDEARYDMFVVVRDFGGRRLSESGARPEVERRYVAYHARLAQQAHRELRGPGQVGWLGLLDAEVDNLRQAMAVAARHTWARECLRLAGGLHRYFYLRGRYEEGRRWLAMALELDDSTEEAPDLVTARATVMAGSGYLAFLQCEYEAADQLLGAALDQYRAAGDVAGAALVLRARGSVARERADYELAVTRHTESLALCRSLADLSGVAWAEHHLGFVAWLRGDLGAAQRLATSARESFTRLGDHEGIVWSLINLGVVARYRDEVSAAGLLLGAALEQARGLEYREGIAWALNQLGALSHRLGHLERAVHELEESLAEHEALGDRWRMASVLEALAAVGHRRGRDHDAGALLGAAEALRARIGAPVPLCERAERESTVVGIRSRIGVDALHDAWTTGWSAPLHAVTEGDLLAAR